VRKSDSVREHNVREILFVLLDQTIDKEDMSEPYSSAISYLVTHLQIGVRDIMCLKAGPKIYIFLPHGTPLREEDMANMHIELFKKDIDSLDIYRERGLKP
jgi:hypothetical protein